MTKKKDEQKKQSLSSDRTGEQFWEDLMNMPYNEDKVGQSFVILQKRKPKEIRNSAQEKK